jgi:hypothetical protein
MPSKFTPIENFLISRVALLLRFAGLVSVASGLIGGCIGFVDLADRADGDDLRWGFWHNPLMQFPPFNEPFLDASMWVLFACSAAAGLGGLMLLAPWKWGVPLVTWQARVSIATNSAIVLLVATAFAFAKDRAGQYRFDGTFEALALRLGSVAVDLALWAFLSSNAVNGFFARRSHGHERAFEVIVKASPPST